MVISQWVKNVERIRVKLIRVTERQNGEQGDHQLNSDRLRELLKFVKILEIKHAKVLRQNRRFRPGTIKMMLGAVNWEPMNWYGNNSSFDNDRLKDVHWKVVWIEVVEGWTRNIKIV